MQIVVIAENEDGVLTGSSLECVEEARDIARACGAQVNALLPGQDVAGLANTLAAHGARTVTLVEHPALRMFSADVWLAALEPLLRALAPALVLAPDSGQMRAWLPRLALRWRAALACGCVELRADDDGRIELTRPTHGGARIDRMCSSGAMPLLATLRPGARGIGPPDLTLGAEIRRITPDLGGVAARDWTPRRWQADPRTVDLSEAERIVAGGLGIGGPDGLKLLEQLADRLGAAIGATRVVTDRGWLPTERQIGTTGKTVAPRLYVAIGISGASQHTQGMAGSEIVIAINTDRTAPMFGLADLGLVGDMRAIVPALIERLDVTTDGRRPTTDD
ncbi:MAG: electron transfer flavoprotein subunit alpha/FixB family protein [Roseiflexaceae bacterium]